MVGSSARLRTLSNVSVSEVLLHYLELEGVRKVFGVPGAATMDVQYQLHKRRDTFAYVVCRQESGAVYMADAYARATGGLGVVLVTSGPGAAAALTGTTNAEADGTPLLTITGEIGEAFSGKGYLQAGIDGRLNIDEIYAAASDYSAGHHQPRQRAHADRTGPARCSRPSAPRRAPEPARGRVEDRASQHRRRGDARELPNDSSLL